MRVSNGEKEIGNRPNRLGRTAVEHLWAVVARLRWAIAAFFLAFFGFVAQGAPLVGRGVFHLAVDGAAFVVFG